MDNWLEICRVRRQYLFDNMSLQQYVEKIDVVKPSVINAAYRVVYHEEAVDIQPEHYLIGSQNLIKTIHDINTESALARILLMCAGLELYEKAIENS